MGVCILYLGYVRHERLLLFACTCPLWAGHAINPDPGFESQIIVDQVHNVNFSLTPPTRRASWRLSSQIEYFSVEQIGTEKTSMQGGRWEEATNQA